MREEKPFEREVLDRLITLEQKNDALKDKIDALQYPIAKVAQHDVDLTRIDASTKSAHKRIDGIFKTASYISAAVALFMSIVQFIVGYAMKGGGHS